MDPVFVKGVLAFIVALLVFVGSVWLLLSLIVGGRLAYLITGSLLFGIMVILSGMWTVNRLGPTGPDTTWHGLAVGPELSQVEGLDETTYDVSDYPEGEWVEPAEGTRLADQHPARSPCLSLVTDCENRDTLTEVNNARPVMETFVSTAISPIPGKREEVAERVQGQVNVKPQEFAIADIRMREAEVDGKTSILAVGLAVPSDQIVPESLGEGVEEAVVEEYLVDEGETVAEGQPVMRATADGQEIQIESTQTGRVITHGLREDDTVKAGVPIAVVDVSGQPGAPEPVEVSAVRVPGAPRRPAMVYLAGSLILFAVHLFLLRRAELARRAAPQPA
ncbi:MAG: biotin/lipoyl-containing protein [Actinomycetota bacterium]